MGSTSQTAKAGGGRLAALTTWIDDRFPMTKMWKEQVSEYYAPKNMNFWYFFGSLAMLVLVGVCTHLGCAPLDKFTPGDATVAADWEGGFFCPCHGSKFDISGRVFKDVPAPTNLPVPPYRFVSDTRILIGAAAENA